MKDEQFKQTAECSGILPFCFLPAAKKGSVFFQSKDGILSVRNRCLTDLQPAWKGNGAQTVGNRAGEEKNQQEK